MGYYLPGSPLASKESTLLEELGLGIGVVSKEGILEFVNSYFFSWAEGKVGVNLYKTPLYKDSRLNKLIVEALKGEPFETEAMKGSVEARNEKYFSYKGRPIMTSGGKSLARLVLIVEDITDKKRMEKDMENYL